MEHLQRSVVYQEPLKLERGHDGTFLETRFTIENNVFRYKLKNDNEGGEVKVWRYMHFHSNAPFVPVSYTPLTLPTTPYVSVTGVDVELTQQK